MNGDWFVYDPDPEPQDGPGPLLWGPFLEEDAAAEHANLLHDEDGSGNTVVLQATQP